MLPRGAIQPNAVAAMPHHRRLPLMSESIPSLCFGLPMF
jgi:hypothetical protein